MQGSASINRRLAFLVLGPLLALVSPAAQSAELIDLSASGGPQAVQVRALIDIQGELKTNADGKEVQRLPVKVAAEQQYIERTLDERAATIRYYREAAADIQLGKADLRHSLRDEARYLVLDSETARPTLYSPLSPLSREELELVETPAALLPLVNLLPDDKVAIGASWKPSDENLARLLCLDVLHQHDVNCKLVSFEEQIATVSMNGKVAGAIEGVSSDIELIAKFNFDVKQRTVTWLALAVRENRAVGHAQPGFETITKLRLVAAPAAVAVELSDRSISELPLQPTAGDALLELRSDKGGYVLHHDRRWRMMVDRHELAVLRFVDRGDLIAQCNVSKLSPLPAGEQLSVEGFQEDVRKTLGKNFGQIVEASQQVTDGGVRVLRVVASGNASELPIQWTYYHLSNEQGARASLVFTIEASLVERFAAVDRELISGFRFAEATETVPLADRDSTEQAAAQPMKTKASTR